MTSEHRCDGCEAHPAVIYSPPHTAHFCEDCARLNEVASGTAMTEQNGSARRCGAVHQRARAVCALPADHEGDHASRQGHWPKPLEIARSQTAEPVPTPTEQTCEAKSMLVLWVLAIAFTLMAVTTTAVFILMVWGTWQDRRQARLERRRLHIQHMADRNGHRRRRVHIDD